MTDSKQDLNTYPDFFYTLYREAATAAIPLKFPTREEATSMRHRLHAFRRRLRRENHPLTLLADKVEIALENTTLIFRPTGYSLMKAMQEANIQIEGPSEKLDYDALDKELLNLVGKAPRE